MNATKATVNTFAQVRPGLAPLVRGVRHAVAQHADWSATAQLVADVLRCNLPGPDILHAHERQRDPAIYGSQTLHAEPDGSFSLVGLVWHPGQVTRIHDHVAWCVFGVVQGIEREELFDATLNPIDATTNHAGDVNGFAPPGDIHRVSNPGPEVAISIHIYGTDLTRVSSVRRYYN